MGYNMKRTKEAMYAQWIDMIDRCTIVWAYHISHNEEGYAAKAKYIKEQYSRTLLKSIMKGINQ